MADKIYPLSDDSDRLSERDHLVSHSKGIENVVRIAMRIIRGEGTDADAITVAKTFLELEDPDGLNAFMAAQDRKISIEEVFKNTNREIMATSAGSRLDLAGWCDHAKGYKIWDHPINKPDTDWLGTLPSGAVIANKFQGYEVPTILWTSYDRHPDRHIDVLLSPEEDRGEYKMTVRLLQHHQLLKYEEKDTGQDFYAMRPNPGGRATDSIGGDRGALVRALFYAGVIPERRGDLASQAAGADEEIDDKFLMNAGFVFSIEYSRKYGWTAESNPQGQTYIQEVQTYEKKTNTRHRKTVEVTLSEPKPNLEWVLRHAGGIHVNAKKRDVIAAIAGNDTNIPNLTPADFKLRRL